MFIPLAEKPSAEIVEGLLGRWWTFGAPVQRTGPPHHAPGVAGPRHATTKSARVVGASRPGPRPLDRAALRRSFDAILRIVAEPPGG